MSVVAGLIPFKAKPGKGFEVAKLVAAALPHVEAEGGTPLWLVLHSNVEPDTVFLVDLFSDAASRDAHLRGAAAQLIFSTVPLLLAENPVIHAADLIAQKGA